MNIPAQIVLPGDKYRALYCVTEWWETTPDGFEHDDHDLETYVDKQMSAFEGTMETCTDEYAIVGVVMEGEALIAIWTNLETGEETNIPVLMATQS